MKKLRKKSLVITFDKSALKDICKMLNIPYSKDIIAFTKKGVLTNSFDLVEKEYVFCGGE